MQNWRRDFHANPEPGFAEHRTSGRVAQLLRDFGIEVHTGIGQTGVVGVLQRGNSTRCIGLRADMDALPIAETNTFDHRSTRDGVMHACGHDGHTSMLLGAACYLAKHGNFNGRIVFIFQPAEEHGQGAAAMIDDGLFDRFPVDDVYGMHNTPGMETGTFMSRSGAIMGSEALFEIQVQGRGGHAAMPHRGVDAITVGAEIVTALQTIVSRKLNPGLNGVVSVTDFKTNGQRNVLPGHAILTGDARALTTDINNDIEKFMRQIVAGICQAHDVTATVSYETIFDVVVNAAEQTANALSAAQAIAGESNTNGTCPPLLVSEDFAKMSNVRPGNFIFVGNGSSGNHANPLHSANYDFNDELLVPGSSYWVELVEQQLAGVTDC